MSNVEVKDSQTLLDIALSECGVAESAWDIALANGTSITDTPDTVSVALVGNKKIAAYYKANNIVPATGNIAVERFVMLNNKYLKFNNKHITK